MSTGNGYSPRRGLLGDRDLIAENARAEFVANVSSLRSALLRQVFDPRRNVYDECGYPQGYVAPQLYQDLYDREAIAARVVEVMPKESWQVQPEILEDDDPESETEFEAAWADLGSVLSPTRSWHKQEHGSGIWEYLLRADVLSGVGQYGVIFLGLSDGLDLSMPAAGVEEVNSLPRTAPPRPNERSLPSSGTPVAVGGAGNGPAPGQPPQYPEDPRAQPYEDWSAARTGPGGVSTGSGASPVGQASFAPPGPGYPVQYGSAFPAYSMQNPSTPVGSNNPGQVAAAAGTVEGTLPFAQGVDAGPPSADRTWGQVPGNEGVGGLGGGPQVGTGAFGTPAAPPDAAAQGVRSGVTPPEVVGGLGTNPADPYLQGWEPPAPRQWSPTRNCYVDGTEVYQLTYNAPAAGKDPSQDPQRDALGRFTRRKPAPGGRDNATQGNRLLYLRVFPESLARITQFEANRNSPRFGMPVMYLVTLNDPTNYPVGSAIGASTISVNVHWTRVIHIVDNSHQATASEVAAAPRMRPVLNNLLALQKLYGASAEGYWKSCFMGMSFETHPSLGGDVIVDKQGLKEQVENWQNGLQRVLLLMGMTARPIAPAVVDPSSQVAVQTEAICIKGGYPVRVFRGSERGELASSMDDGQWNDRLRERQHNYVTPRVIVPFVDRLIMLGVLPEPSEYRVVWPDLEAQTAAQKAQVAQTLTTALASYNAIPDGPGKPTLRDYLTRVWDWDDETVDTMIDNIRVEAQQRQQQQLRQALDQYRQMLAAGIDPRQAAVSSGIAQPGVGMNPDGSIAGTEPEEAPPAKPNLGGPGEATAAGQANPPEEKK